MGIRNLGKGIIFGLILSWWGAPVQANESQPVLNILTWSEYIDPEIIKSFESRFEVKVKQTYFESDELRDHMLQDSQGVGYDLVVLNGVSVATYGRLGWLATVPKEEIPNLKHIEPRWVTAFDMAENHAVPYFWGTMGIAYRSDKITQEITSWRQLLQPDQSLSGKILMIKDSADLIGAALKSLGYSLNSTDSVELKQAEALLLAQKPMVKFYSVLTMDEASPIVTGSVWASMAYSGDALVLKEHNAAIEYVLPSEGGSIWIDYWSILAKSTKKPLAEQFLNFINEPEINAQNAQHLYYATPNKAAEKLLPADFLADPIVYPTELALKNSEFYELIEPRKKRKRNVIFSQVIK